MSLELPPLGSVIQGSLSQGLEVRLHAEVLVEDMRVGKFLVVQGRRSRFFCMLTDVALGTSSPRILANPPEPENTFLQEVLAGTGTYGTVNLTPMLMISDVQETGDSAQGTGQESNSKLKISPMETLREQNSPPQNSLPTKLNPAPPSNCCPSKRFPVTLAKCSMRVSGIFGRCLAGKMIPIGEILRSVSQLIWKCPFV